VIDPAEPVEVLGALARAGRDNPLLGLAGGTGGAPAVRLRRGGAARLVEEVGAWLGHPEPRVAASMVVLGYGARLVGPAIATVLRDGVLVDLRPDRVGYTFRPGYGFRLALVHPAGWRGSPDALWPRWCEQVVDGHLGGLVESVRAVVPVAAGLLWGNVASGLTGALAALVGSVPLAECHEAGLVLLDHGPLRGSGQLDVRAGRLRFRRRSCCLFYRLPGGGTCGDFPLRPGATVS